ncbi:MAG: DNA repair protein RadC [Candidatus Omnitrophica bacterium]|jgi:DNA repair protein RadC|nr:DNA repair protein RadC [Candidatus Omnitrophota bacterium]MDD5690283.1 DNA repair protein RadC [Candidatus Omnitrophota bacterium]
MPINNWPNEDRPREKLLKNGEHTLNNSELLAIILRTGTKGESALDLARRILQKFNCFRSIGKQDLAHWKQIKGLGNAKISQIKAAIEIARRFSEETIREKRLKIKSSGDIINILMPRMQDLRIEVFKVLLLNSQNRIIDIIEIEEGSVNQARPIIREIYQKALQEFASFIICVHNHPSGNPRPSREDKQFTRQLVTAGEALFVKCLDHVIIGDGNYFSFSDEGII